MGGALVAHPHYGDVALAFEAPTWGMADFYPFLVLTELLGLEGSGLLTQVLAELDPSGRQPAAGDALLQAADDAVYRAKAAGRKVATGKYAYRALGRALAAHALEPASLAAAAWPPLVGALAWGLLRASGWSGSRRPSFVDRAASCWSAARARRQRSRRNPPRLSGSRQSPRRLHRQRRKPRRAFLPRRGDGRKSLPWPC